MRPLLPLLLALAAGAAAAQQQPLVREPAGEPRKNQKIERIVVEDGANRVDELRVGGESRNVTVQPKGGGRAYEMLPSDLARQRPENRREGQGAPRVWNLGNF